MTERPSAGLGLWSDRQRNDQKDQEHPDHEDQRTEVAGSRDLHARNPQRRWIGCRHQDRRLTSEGRYARRLRLTQT